MPILKGNELISRTLDINNLIIDLVIRPAMLEVSRIYNIQGLPINILEMIFDNFILNPFKELLKRASGRFLANFKAPYEGLRFDERIVNKKYMLKLVKIFDLDSETLLNTLKRKLPKAQDAIDLGAEGSPIKGLKTIDIITAIGITFTSIKVNLKTYYNMVKDLPFKEWENILFDIDKYNVNFTEKRLVFFNCRRGPNEDTFTCTRRNSF